MDHPKLELYYYDSCPYCQMVLDVIEQLKLQIHYRNIWEHPEYRQKLIADTGRKTVPCLYIDGEPMHESRDIIRWLQANAEKLAKERLA